MGETFGAWELRQRLGQNELGDTHLAVRTRDGVQAVVKRIRREANDEQLQQALQQELALAAKLEHPAATRILAQGEVDGVAYVALEYVEGLSLARLCSAAQATGGWPLSMARAVSVMTPVLEALAAAHALVPPLLHRDVVPENVRVTPAGRTVLTDFGLGRARQRAGGGVGMRRAYVSPEQARGHTIDARSEVFAAGLMLFELVCGRLPANGGPGEVISRIATGELDAPLDVNPKLDPATVAVLGRALALKPEDRFPSVAALCAALTPWAGAAGEVPLAEWAGKLALVKLAPPVAEKAKPPAMAPLVPPATPAATAAAPVKTPSPWRARRIALGVAAAVVFVTAQVVDFRSVFGTQAVDLKAGRPLELTTIPSGAQVWVDGVLEDRRTPLTLYFPKDEFRNLVVKKPGLGSWTGIVYNSHKLEITLATGAIEEERYEGQRPPTRVEPPPPVPPELEATAPKPEVVFDVESPPIETVLTAAHSVRADLGPSVELAPGAEVSLVEGGSLYFPAVTPQVTRAPRSGEAAYRPNRPGLQTNWAMAGGQSSFRPLNLFALHVEDGQPLVYDLSRPVNVAFGGKYFLFTPSEAGELGHGTVFARLDGTSVPLTTRNLLRVDAIDSFLVRVLRPTVRYRLVLSRADGSGAPLPPVIMTLRPDADPTNQPTDTYDSSLRFDGEVLPSGQALVGPGVHTLTGARNVWFTIIAAGDKVPPDVPEVKLSLQPVQGLMPKGSKKAK